MNLFFPMLLVGLVTSVHCVTMCGTLVLSYAIKGDGGGTWRDRMLPHAAYQGAKILSYVAVGLLLGAIGAAFDLGGVRGWVTIFAGVFMVLMGLNMTGKFPWLRWIALRPPKFLMTALMKLRKKANADASAGESTILTPILFGAMTGLMPCGPLQSAQIAAAGAGSPISGAIAMLGFGLGTMPLMLGFGAVSGMLGNKFKERMMVVAAVVIMLVGLVMANRGAMLVGSPVTFQSAKAYVLGSPTPAGDTQFATGADGVTEVKLTIANVKFQPANVAIPADKPVRLIVDRQEDNSCSAQLAIPQLGVLADLADNAVTVVDIPAAKAGNYTLTCGMGMMAGQLTVGGGAAGGSRLPLLALLAAAAGAGAWALTRRPQPAPVTAHGSKHTPSTAPAGTTTIFGFSATEALVVGVAIAAAVMAGLYLGGVF